VLGEHSRNELRRAARPAGPQILDPAAEGPLEMDG